MRCGEFFTQRRDWAYASPESDSSARLALGAAQLPLLRQAQMSDPGLPPLASPF